MCGRNPDMSAGEFGVTSYQSKVWRTWRTGGLFLCFFNNKITATLSSFKKTTVMFQIIFWAAVWKCSAQRLWFRARILTMCRCELPVVSVSVNRCTMQLNIKHSRPLYRLFFQMGIYAYENEMELFKTVWQLAPVQKVYFYVNLLSSF